MSFRDQQIQLEVFNPRSTSLIEPIVATVNDEIEFSNFPSDVINTNVDFSDSSIQIDYTNAGGSGSSASSTFNGYVFTDVSGNIPAIKNVTIDSSITNLGIKRSDITFTENTIEVDFQGTSYNANSLVKLDVEFGETENTGFLGSQIEREVFNPRSEPISSKTVATVNNGFEFTRLPDSAINGSSLVDLDVDFTAENIFFDFTDAGTGTFNSSTFNGSVYSDVGDTLPPITNVTIDRSETTLGLSNSDVTFTEDSIEINVEGLSYNSETTAKFDVEFGETDDAGLLGNQIELETFNPRNEVSSSKIVATVNNGFEFTRLPESAINSSSLIDVNINLGANGILLDFTDAGTGDFASSSFNGYVFSDITETLPAITNVTIERSETTLALDDSDINFTEDTIEINVEGLSFTSETTALLNVELQGDTPDKPDDPSKPDKPDKPDKPVTLSKNTIELFRFRNTSFDTGTYVFVGTEERDNILESENLRDTFSLDGRQEDETINPAFKASTVSEEGLIPFYRLKSVDVAGTFLYVSTAEYNTIFDADSEQKDQWEQEGLDEEDNDIPEFYLYDGNADIGTKFNRFQNTENGTFLYAGEAETEAIENDPNLSSLFTNQGVAFESL
jgi:hypothetical protein